MATKIITDISDFFITNINSPITDCARYTEETYLSKFNEGAAQHRFLKFYTLLIGEDKPKMTALPNNYIGESSDCYRYDWQFGISCISSVNVKNTFWDWKSHLRKKESLKIQLVFESPPNNIVFPHIISANLLCLNPTKDISQWHKKNKEEISQSLKSLADISSDFNKTAGEAFKFANMLTSFIPSDDKGKNWYIYKFLDQERSCFAIEWNINKKVLDQFGSLLHGSIVASFHGNPNEKPKLKLRLLPSISFKHHKPLESITPYDNKNPAPCIDICPE
jgi:hypothetical protein